MKKFIYTLGIVAAATFAFSACQKEKDVKADPSDELVTITFTAEKAGVGTRTAAVEGENEVSFIWTNEDVANIKLFTVSKDAEGKENLDVVQNPTVTKVSDTKLTISASVAPGAYTFRAVLAGQWTNDGKKPRVKDIQGPTATNYDPSADVLVSDDMEIEVVDSGEETVATQDMEMVFRRPIVVNKMTLKNLTAGDVIKKVVISGNPKIAGSFTKLEPFADKDAITINYNDGYTIPEGGQFPVYFTTLPASSLRLTVEVTTEQYVYSKSFAEGATIDFNKGEFTTFGFALPAGVANTALTLPLEDSMEWAMTHETDLTTELSVTDWAEVLQNGKKIYASSTKAYKGVDGMKLGSSGARGSITTNEINLSSAFFVAIDAKTYGTDESQLVISIDGEEVFTSGNLTSEYKTYYADCSAATSASTVTIGIKGKRGYIKSLSIKEGESPAPPTLAWGEDSITIEADDDDSHTIALNATHSPSISVAVFEEDEETVPDWIVASYDNGIVTYAAEVNTSNLRRAVIIATATNDYGSVTAKINVTQKAADSHLTKGPAWTYTFANNPFTNNTASLSDAGLELVWTTSVSPSYTNDALSFGTNNNPAAATMTTTSYVDGISSIVISIKGNSTKSVKAAVSVGGEVLTCEGNASVTQNGNTLTEYEFSSSALASGDVVISFTEPTGGYQIKRIAINPEPLAPATITGISVEEYTAAFTATESGTYAFDGKVYAVYSDGTKAEIASSNYSITGSVDLTTPGTYTLAISATIEGTTYSKDIVITVNPIVSEYESNGNLATFTFTDTSHPSNKTNFTATSGACPNSTFYLNGSGSTWNTSKGYAFTAVDDVTVTVKTEKALKQGGTITLSMDTFYNKASNAPMTGFTITASESGGSAGTTGLNVTSWSLSTTSETKTVIYTLQNDVAANSTVTFVFTQTGKVGAGQGFINNVIVDYSAN